MTGVRNYGVADNSNGKRTQHDDTSNPETIGQIGGEY